MRTSLTAALAALLLAAPLLAGCSAARPVGLSASRGFCNTAGSYGSNGNNDSGGGGSCMEQLKICGKFFDPLAAGVADRVACLAQCGAANAELFHVHVLDDCRLGVVQANDLCEEYCRGNFQ